MRGSLWVSLAIASAALVGCGDQTATVILTAPGATISFVVTGSSDAVKSFESQMETLVPGIEQTGAGAQTFNGDHHAGALVCQSDVTADGFNDHVAVYSTIAGLGPELCSEVGRAR